MERAKPAEIFSRFLEAHVFADNPNNVGLLLDPLRSGTRFCHQILRPQFYNCDRFPSAVFRLERLLGDQRVSLEKLTETLPQRTGAVSMNNAHPRNVCESCIIEKFIDALRGLFDRRTD